MPIHDEAFRKLKSAIVKDMMLKYFDANLPIYIETDASRKGIGVVLMQLDPNVQNTSKTSVPNNVRPVYYASKDINDHQVKLWQYREGDVRRGL